MERERGREEEEESKRQRNRQETERVRQRGRDSISELIKILVFFSIWAPWFMSVLRLLRRL